MKGFTLIELIIVIVILGILSVVAAPRFIAISTDAKISALQNIASQIRSTNKLVQAKAKIQGLSIQLTNPETLQSAYLIDFDNGQVEVHYRNLCVEAMGELGDALGFFDFMNISLDGKLNHRTTNQYAIVGYDIPSSGLPTDQGCFVVYDSFDPSCEVTVVTADC